MMRRLSNLPILLLFLSAFNTEVVPQLSAQTITSENNATPARIESKLLPNAIRVTANLISGGLPESDAAFAELQSLGVKTVISVDGAAPDIETARKHGLRYVHLPHGYDGVPTTRGMELAKAIKELEGSIYIHCHHGKHRSPAATAVACIVSGRIANSDGKALLEMAGTNPNYLGLWKSVAIAEAVPPANLAGLKVDFRETADVNPLAKAMVELDERFEWIRKQLEKGRNEANAEALAEAALLVTEDYAEMLRLEETKRFPDGFADQLRNAMSQSNTLEASLRSANGKNAFPDSTTESTSQTFKMLSDGCKRCHTEFRDNVQSKSGRNSR